MTDTTGPGHGGKNNFDMGAGGGGRWERTEVVKINAYFRQWNPGWLDVGDVLGTNVNQNLINIVNNTNRVGNSWERTLSHHLNAFNGKATGTEVWYYAGDEAMRKVAAQISASIAKDLGIADRGAKATTSLYVVANTNPHCLLIEWYFVDNPNDRAAWDRNGTTAMINVMKILRMKTPTSGGGNTVKPPAGSADYNVVNGKKYWKKPGHYTALRDDVMYSDLQLTKKTGNIIKKGTRYNILSFGVAGSGYVRAKMIINGYAYYFTMREDFWKYTQ